MSISTKNRGARTTVDKAAAQSMIIPKIDTKKAMLYTCKRLECYDAAALLLYGQRVKVGMLPTQGFLKIRAFLSNCSVLAIIAARIRARPTACYTGSV